MKPPAPWESNDCQPGHTITMGIDPGLQGAIGVIAPFHQRTFRMPYKAQGGPLDVERVLSIIQEVNPCHIAVEEQVARPSQGKSGSIMMKNYGMLIAMLELAKIPYTEVRPQVWQKAILGIVPKGETKQYSINHVRRAFPKVNLKVYPKAKDKEHDGIADAMCIAEYCIAYVVNDRQFKKGNSNA